MDGKYISYLRVSTQQQNDSGLGLEAQRHSIENYLNGGNWKVIAEYIEVESGRKADRPELRKALEHSKRTKSTLIIAKLDRLSRNVAFLSNLMESGIEFIAVDAPHANKFMIHILSAAAQYEAEMISKRTKEALAAAKARGVKLGNPYGFSRMKRNDNPDNATKKRIEKADAYSASMYPIVKKLIDEGFSLNAIAKRMMENKELTPRDGSVWTPTTVKQILKRVEKE